MVLLLNFVCNYSIADMFKTRTRNYGIAKNETLGTHRSNFSYIKD